jgi:ABC-type transport system substrate-binding protein
MLHNVYERLLTRDKDYRLAPSLAVSWTRAFSHALRLQLRKGVVFH